MTVIYVKRRERKERKKKSNRYMYQKYIHISLYTHTIPAPNVRRQISSVSSFVSVLLSVCWLRKVISLKICVFCIV